MEERFLGVAAVFDEKTNEKFEKIKKLLQEIGLQPSSIYPHLTLGCYVDVDQQALCDHLEGVCSNIHPFEINFNHLGLFGLNSLFLAPHVSMNLMAIHQKINEQYDDYSGEIGYNYSIKSNNWVPHATIFSGDPKQVMQALPVVTEAFKPFVGKIIGFKLCEFYPMVEVQEFLLS